MNSTGLINVNTLNEFCDSVDKYFPDKTNYFKHGPERISELQGTSDTWFKRACIISATALVFVAILRFTSPDLFNLAIRFNSIIISLIAVPYFISGALSLHARNAADMYELEVTLTSRLITVYKLKGIPPKNVQK